MRESRDKIALVLPVAGQAVLFEPVRGKSGRLRPCKDLAHQIGREEGKVDHVLDAAARSARIARDVGQPMSCLNLLIPLVGFGDIADQGLVRIDRGILQDQPGFHTAFAHQEGGVQGEGLLVDCMRSGVAKRCKPGRIQRDCQRPGPQVDARDKAQQRRGTGRDVRERGAFCGNVCTRS